ncbi:DAK2 domain-containing protein [Longispora albida]|uniref:DAK2 domain-containing protein n=1 Tax=Longispora albida TaxID=203523 RepID=UPI000382AA1B|nr:DAK2 domain-containing protein [Longispora albida]
MLDSLDAGAVRRWLTAALDALRRHQREIDELNVYPIPDSDTGTNMVHTLDAAQRALLAEPDLAELGKVLHCMARAAVLGARGNSGAILAQLLVGIAEAIGASPEARGRALAWALRNAAEAGYAAVPSPVEGTVLSVARSAAEAAEECDSDDLAEVAAAAARGADEALARTPEQLPALAEAGVVDAGGRGLCVFLHSLVEVVTGAAPPRTPLARVTGSPALAAREAGSEEYAYEVQYLLDAPATGTLRAELAGLGDSLVIVGTGDGSWNIHIHVNDIGAAIEAGVRAGRIYEIRVTRFADDHTPALPGRTVVAFAEGEGLGELLRAEGALTSLDGVTGQVVILGAPPYLPDRARVIPLRSPVQALAALAVHDRTRPLDDDVIAMAEAAAACRAASVVLATHEGLTMAGPCRPGDYLAMIDGEVNLVAHDLTSACETVIDRLLTAGGELVTLLLGAQAPAPLGPALTSHLARRWPFVEVRAYPGGQPGYLTVGVE